MKRIFQISKIFLLCVAALCTQQAAAQTIPTQYTVQQGQCVDLGVDSLGLTSYSVLQQPANGTLAPGIRPGSWVYCPDSTFVGMDQAYVISCVNGWLLVVCDTTPVTFIVQPLGCNLTASITNGSPCAGPLPSLTAVATGGTPPYLYQWSTGQTGQYACNLTSGMYCLTVTDAQGCIATDCYTVGCQIPVTVAFDTAGCLISAVTGGSGPYTYLWSSGQTTSLICNVVPTLNYCLTVTDAQGCGGYACSPGNPCNLSLAVVPGGCAGPLPSLTATVTGGTPPYQYLWNNGDLSDVVCQLTSGVYCVTVTDANNCTASTCDTIVGCLFTVTVAPDSSGCLISTVSGGSPPYSYVWVTGDTTSSICNVNQGILYCVTVSDAQGCTGFGCSNSNPCNLYLSVVPGGCAGPLPSLTAAVTGGTQPYSYYWNNNAVGSTICNLSAGTYCVTVTDMNGCSASTCDTVVNGGCQFPVTVAYDSLSGCYTSNIIGGSAPFLYQWSTGDTTSDLCNVNPGLNYCVTVADAQGCIGFACAPGNCNMTSTVVSAGSTCLQVVSTGGAPPYSYVWDNGFVGGPTICPGAAGTYCVTIADQLGCTDYACGTVTTGCNLFGSIGQQGSCLVAAISGGTPPYTYTWNPGFFSGSSICPGAAGTYCLTVTDINGCTFSTCGTLSNGCQFSVSVTLDSSRCMRVIATGGSAPYTYLWSDGSTGAVNCNYFPGITYAVTVTDAQGCTGSGVYYEPCQLSFILQTDSLTGCATPVITSSGANIVAYRWSDGSTASSNCNLSPGINYCLTIVDANGCSAAACTGQTSGCSFSYQTQTNPLDSTILVVFVAQDPNNTPSYIDWTIDNFTGTGSGNAFTYIYNTCNVNSFVTMTEHDTLGNILCTYSQSIYIPCDTFIRTCQAYFTSSNLNPGQSTNTIMFFNQSVYNPVSYQWDFGDGSFSTAPNPVHTFAATGSYTVCLVIVDASGCSSSYCDVITAGNPQVQDLAAYLYHHTTVTPGFPLWVHLTYCNYGTLTMSGTVEYRYPAGTTFVSANPAPVSHNIGTRLLTFNFSNLLPGTCDDIAVDLNASSNLFIGTPVHDTMWVKPIVGDVNPTDNVSFIKDYVNGSWDPNDKAVSPKGDGADGNIPLNTEVIAYKIRFQNTGTSAAQNVVIHDAMDSNIDLTTVRVMSASHEHITQLIGNELVVTFNNILLPDSNSDEAASHGYIQVVAHLKPGLAEGTQVFNTAEIVFDFNEPVITNTVVNTLKDTEIGIRSIDAFTFSIVPNPAQDKITISGKFSRNTKFEIMNELGQVVLNDEVTADKIQVDITSLHPGVYLVRIKGKDKVGVQRLVVSE